MSTLYMHKVQYYETDKMGVVHHSNYIRWFEEARTDFLDRAGIGYDIVEAKGIMLPVIKASCEYKASVAYGKTVAVSINIKTYNGIKLIMEYKVLSEDMGTLHAIGETTHCFLNNDFKPVNIKKYNKEVADFFETLVAKE